MAGDASGQQKIFYSMQFIGTHSYLFQLNSALANLSLVFINCWRVFVLVFKTLKNRVLWPSRLFYNNLFLSMVVGMPNLIAIDAVIPALILLLAGD
jgi:hypothetical protein